MHLRIRHQAVLVSAIPLAFLLLLLALALAIQHDTFRASARAQQAAEILADGEAVIKTLTEANAAVTAYEQKPSPEAYAKYRSAASAMPVRVTELRSAVSGEPQAQRQQAEALIAVTGRAMILLRNYEQDLRSGRVAAAQALGRAPSTRALGTELERASQAFNAGEQRLTVLSFNSVRTRIQQFGLGLILCCALGLLLTLLVSGRFGLSIARRLEQLAENARALATGRPSAPIDGDDEIARLDRVYREMTLRIQREHQISSTLQRVLLPQDFPHIPGLRIDTAYVPAAKHTDVGGDWYDLFELGNNRVCLSVGDVTGHGLHAATVMGAARLAIRTAARAEQNPGALLRHVNRVICDDYPGVFVTSFVGILDLTDGKLSYGIAGHPPPIRLDADGSHTLLEGDGMLLGADRHVRFDTFEFTLAAGSGLVLYTDGIVEVRREFLSGLERLERAASAEFLASPPNIAEAIQRRIFDEIEPHDDSALLFVGLTHVGSREAEETYSWQLDAKDEGAMRRTKRALLACLHDAASSGAELQPVELIFAELIGNVARHTPGEASVVLELSDGQATLHIADRGAPFEHRASAPDLLDEGGRGLFLVQSIADRVEIRRTPEGNCVSAVLPVMLNGYSKRSASIGRSSDALRAG